MEPVRKEVVVEAPVERAFRVFTDKFNLWWPREHHIGAAEMAEAIIEPRVGGRWYEKGVDGSECEWGQVLTWDPPKRVVMKWQLDHEWKFDPSLHTEVEVRFTPIAPMQTRVELEHRLLENMGEHAAMVRAGVDSEQGWGMLMSLFANAASAQAV
jgi:uncharacterized protein YndB with AHSA1/START domain